MSAYKNHFLAIPTSTSTCRRRPRPPRPRDQYNSLPADNELNKETVDKKIFQAKLARQPWRNNYRMKMMATGPVPDFAGRTGMRLRREFYDDNPSYWDSKNNTSQKEANYENAMMLNPALGQSLQNSRDKNRFKNLPYNMFVPRKKIPENQSVAGMVFNGVRNRSLPSAFEKSDIRPPGVLSPAVMNSVKESITLMLEEAKKRLVEVDLPHIAEIVVDDALNTNVADIIEETGTTAAVNKTINTKFQEAWAKTLSTVMAEKFGQGIEDVMKDLEDGKIVCSKPCECGPSNVNQCGPNSSVRASASRSRAASTRGSPAASGAGSPGGGGGGQYDPADCASTCQCQKAMALNSSKSKTQE